MAVAIEEIGERLRDVELKTQSNTDRISSHEDLCAERYKNINDALETIKKVMFWVGAALITGMAAILVSQVFPK